MGDKVERLEWLGLAGILAVALGLRLIQLDSGLWYDEVMTLVNFVRLPTTDLLTTYSSLNNHILYSLAAKASVSCLGESAWALRLPAMLFGVGSIAATWWLGRQLLSRGESLLAALLLACSTHHIWFSQNARGYTGLLLAALVSTTLFVKGMQRPSRRLWISYATVLALAMYVHLSAAFLFATHGLIFITICLKQRIGGQQHDKIGDAPGNGPWIGFGLGALFTLLCYAPVLPQMVDTFTEVSTGQPQGVGVTEWKNPIWTVIETVKSFGEGNPLIPFGVVVGGLLALVGVIHLFRRHPLFALIPLIHVPLTFAILIIGSFRIWPRYFFIDAGFAILCLVHGTFVIALAATKLLRRKERSDTPGQWSGVAVTLIIIVGSLFLLPQTYQLPKQDFVGARDFVESTRLPGDSVASLGLASTVYSEYLAPEWDVVENLQQLEQLHTRARHTWLVYSFPTHTIANFPAIVERIEKEFELVRTFWGTLREGQVLVYRSR